MEVNYTKSDNQEDRDMWTVRTRATSEENQSWTFNDGAAEKLCAVFLEIMVLCLI